MRTKNTLKKIRRELGITQAEFATEINVTIRHYQGIESGKANSSEEIQGVISKYLISKGYGVLEEDLFPKENQDFYELGKRNSLEQISHYAQISEVENNIEYDHIKQVVIDRLKQTRNSRDLGMILNFYGINSKEKTIEELAGEHKLSYERIKQIVDYGTRVFKNNGVKRAILNSEDVDYEFKNNMRNIESEKKELEIPLWWIAEKFLREYEMEVK